MVSNQLLNVSGVLCITLAMATGYVTLVNGLASTQPFCSCAHGNAGLSFPNSIKRIIRRMGFNQKIDRNYDYISRCIDD
ncbi:hypothetical protein [Legionella tunisiensis]|uniref:hypothetical protein n=1 Tax=Legionella tunisiensis TaxID=1034944 RepID=UPI0012EAC2B2|nr:hypothetical protein [Legionella tunisiensis]